MGTERGLERIIFFTDAVAAIAITLLILPLVDIVPTHPAHGTSVIPLLHAHLPQIASFALSFAVIARFWITHHAIFEHVERYNSRLRNLSLAWAFTIVLLPLPTAITAAFSSSPFTIGLYLGTMLLSSLTLTAIIVSVRGNAELESEENPISRSTLVNGVAGTACIAVAFVIGVAIPHVTYWGLLLLLFSTPVNHFVMRILARRDARHAV